MRTLKTISKFVLALFMIVAGVNHFINPEFYLAIMPPYIPFHLAMVYLSGLCEFVLGVMLLIPGYSRLAAWGIILLLIAVFPANLHMYLHQDEYDLSPTLLLVRLPLQVLFILWAFWHTRPVKRPAPPRASD